MGTKGLGFPLSIYLLHSGVPNLQDLMPDDLRWNGCNNNRYKVHNKCNTLESSQTTPHNPFVEKLSFMKPVPGAKRLQTTAGLLQE